MNDLIEFLNARLAEDERRQDLAAKIMQLRPTTEPFGKRLAADLASKRAIIELHRLEVKRIPTMPFDPITGQPQPPEHEVTCAVCGWASGDPTSACETLRHLAGVYRGHGDWREEWAA